MKILIITLISVGVFLLFTLAGALILDLTELRVFGAVLCMFGICGMVGSAIAGIDQ